ncbi:MAG: hypothetical protein PHQ72_14410 [Hespellia sp.]|nr:hypothetical protein [Hespellia sp.]
MDSKGGNEIKEQKKKVTANTALFEELGGTYIRDGSGLYYPDLHPSDVESRRGDERLKGRDWQKWLQVTNGIAN